MKNFDTHLLRYAPDVVLITNSDGRIIFVNDNALKVLGYSEAEFLSMTVLDVSPTAYAERLASVTAVGARELREVHLIGKTGQKIPAELNLVKMPNGLLYGSYRDISERKQAEISLHKLTYCDALTQLPNRRALLKELQHSLMHNNRHFGALLVIDLDHFKSFKAAVGDALLIEVTQRLQAMRQVNHSLACIGGDVFGLILEPISRDVTLTAELADLLARKISTALKKVFIIQDKELRISASIGIALFSGDKESPDELLKQAKSAMDEAKRAGRDTIKFYNPSLQSALLARHELERELRFAIEQQQFILYYQVQVDSQARVLGAEVLVRWQHPQRGMISPTEFIALSEESGLILPLGLWVLEQACAQLKTWQKSAQLRDLVLAVNVSTKQLQAVNFVAQVQKILLDTGAKGSQLKLELTESAVLENIEDSIEKMRALQLLGIRFSLDDFGTGHSSLQYLKRLPLDQIKIDQSFVRDITTDPNDAVIVKTIISMSDALGLNVIAEGVETRAQRDFLEAHGCHFFQGYWFGKPLPLNSFVASLQKT